MSEDIDFPVLDNHMHLRPGTDYSAVTDFTDHGGTHLCIVNLPSWIYDITPTEPADYREVFESHLEVVENAADYLTGNAMAVLGVHPAEIDNLADRMTAEESEDLMKAGMDEASRLVEEEKAIALKSGRPHYDVSDEIWNASNRVLSHAITVSSDVGCALQLHTEQTDDLSDVHEMARDAGMDTDKVIKHYSRPNLTGALPSVMSRTDWLEEACRSQVDFLMETDYLDDPDRPGAVMVPKTVPRRVKNMVDKHRDELVNAHVNLPEKVYGIEMQRN